MDKNQNVKGKSLKNTKMAINKETLRTISAKLLLEVGSAGPTANTCSDSGDCTYVC